MHLEASERELLAAKLRKAASFGLVLLVLLYLVSGGFKVEAEEAGVRWRFGEYLDTVGPGMHLGLPWPMDRVKKVNIRSARRILVGFSKEAKPEQDSLPIKPYCLTGDTNILHATFALQYRVSDPYEYLHAASDPEALLLQLADAVILEEVSNRSVDALLITEKNLLASKIREKLQKKADNYQLGLTLLSVDTRQIQPPAQVQAAFQQVITAREQKSTHIFKAKDYGNAIAPKARGQARSMVEKAHAEKNRTVSRARGLAERFNKIYPMYASNPKITRDRLFLEMAKTAFADVKVIVLDENNGGPVKLRMMRNDPGGIK